MGGAIHIVFGASYSRFIVVRMKEAHPGTTFPKLFGRQQMPRFLVHSTFGLVIAAALIAMPAEAKAQYVSSGVGVGVATPGFGVNLAFGQPVVRPAPVFVPAYS